MRRANVSAASRCIPRSLAADARSGVVIETATWRANPDWGARLGYNTAALDRINREAVHFLRDLASEFDAVEVIVSGNIGPRGDGYNPAELLNPDVAEGYHRPQIDSFVSAGADRVKMLTATHPGEPIGIVRAAFAAGIPAVVIAFTVETDGRLPNGQALHEAIEEVDAATEGAALHSASTAPILTTSPPRSTWDRRRLVGSR